MLLSSRVRIFRILLSLIALMLLFNGYTLFLFIRGFTMSEGAWGDDPLPATDSVLLFYDQNAPTIRFRSSVTGDLVVVVPSKDTPAHLITTAQTICARYKDRVPLVAQSLVTHSLNRLQKLLRPSNFNNLTISDTYAKSLWNSFQQWPFSDSLRLASLGNILALTQSARIESAKAAQLGTQLKIEVELQGGQKAFFKPEWYPRNVKLHGTPYAGKDRHFGEIAAFYLNLLLGFYNSPIVTGIRVNPAVLEAVANPKLKNTFSRQNGSLCFYGVCHFCVSSEPVCAPEGQTVEGAMMLLLNRKFRSVSSPWRRTYKVGSWAPWELYKDFCPRLVIKDHNNLQRIQSILDMTSIGIFDFLIGNGDRHHFEMTSSRRGDIATRFLLLDNGKSFGNSQEDYIDLLAPLFQCCKVRENLINTLRKWEGLLGKGLDTLTKMDPLYPLLDNGHLIALDRRLRIVLSTVEHCQRHKDNRKILY